MSEYGCYTLDLYCDAENSNHAFDEFPHQFIDQKGSSCRRMARRRGWVFKRDGTTICPRCSGKAYKTSGNSE